MTEDEAMEARVTSKQAIRELKLHGVISMVADGGNILCHHSGETITKVGKDGMYSGGDILAWLGY